MGVAAVLLTAYFTLRVERRTDVEPGPGLGELWRRFPKFVLGFVAASVIATWYASTVRGATRQGHHRRGQRPADLVPDLRLREHRPGVQCRQRAPVRLASSGSLRRRDGGEPGGRAGPVAAALRVVRLLSGFRADPGVVAAHRRLVLSSLGPYCTGLGFVDER